MDEKYPQTEIAPKGKFFTWLDNYWYHYKWHTLIGAFALIVIVVCTLQMCSKEKYDLYVLYAGDTEISERANAGGVSPAQTLAQGLRREAGDLDGDGNSAVALQTLFYMTPDQISSFAPEDGYELNLNLLSENAEMLRNQLLMSDYYLLILSREAYEYHAAALPGVFEDLSARVAQQKRVDGCAVLLSETALSALPGFSDLPADTVVCVRALSDVTKKLNKRSAETYHARALTVLDTITKG